MIKNKRQYKITRKQVQQFKESIQNFNSLDLIERGIDPLIAEAQLRAMRSQLHDLESSLSRFEVLQSNPEEKLYAEDLVSLGAKLIEARIARGLTQKELAQRLGMKQQQIQRYEKDNFQSANLQRLSQIAAVLDVAVEIQLALGNQLSIGDSKSNSSIVLPHKAMKARGWLEGPIAKIGSELVEDSHLAILYVTKVSHNSSLRALHRQSIRISGKYDEGSLLAWKARVLHLATEANPTLDGTFASDPDFIKELVQLSASNNGPLRAISLLKEIGVTVVIEKHLDKTHLDGAAMLLEGTYPVIGMTLRHDRLDNFWFVLLHELGHVVCHRNSGLSDGFFDDASANSVTDLEKEADEFAENALISHQVWDSSFVKHSNDSSHIVRFAKGIGINPAIVAGRIRKERNSYNLFTDLVGRNKLRSMLDAQSQIIGGYRAD